MKEKVFIDSGHSDSCEKNKKFKRPIIEVLKSFKSKLSNKFSFSSKPLKIFKLLRRCGLLKGSKYSRQI